MNESPLSRSWHWGVEGVNRQDRLRMLDVEFHPRSRAWCVGCVCVCVSRLGLGVIVNLVVSASCRRFVWLWWVSSGCGEGVVGDLC